MTIEAPGVEAEISEADRLEAFLAEQIELLGELDLLVVVPVEATLDAVAIEHREDGGYDVRIPTRPPRQPLPMRQREQLDTLGYRVRDAEASLGDRQFSDAPQAAAAAATVLREVFGHVSHTALDVRHGTRRPEREAARKLEALRAQLEPVLTEMLGRAASRDADGDYLVPHSGTVTIVAPRAFPGAIPLVRVATISNSDVAPSAELGMLLANLNFGLAVGRFALDTEHRAIWVDETLLGEVFSPEVIRLAVEIVAHTAGDWAPRLQQLFGGQMPRQTDGESQALQRKPGEGGYL